MRTLSQRASIALVITCALFGLAVAVVGAVGIVGVRSTTAVANRIASDEVETGATTSRVGRLLDHGFATGGALLRNPTPSQAAALASDLYDHTVPALETNITHLVALHADDDAAELAGIARFTNNWHTMRAVLNRIRSGGDTSAQVAELSAAYAPLSSAIAGFINRESADAIDGRKQADAAGTKTTWAIIAAILILVSAAAAMVWFGRRAVRRAVEPARDQADFGDALQLAKDEDETHRLLQRHLERSIPQSTAVVLNRNNSADRLEAMTRLPIDSALVASLQSADPLSCLAIRSAQPHLEDDHGLALLACAVCSVCPGNSMCNPLTVGGEVIGSVLINRPAPYGTVELERVRDSVGQAAPVLANLRNLAIAEFRAATDSLTGLPNKRAVSDTTKRMFAQASRTETPVSLLMLDLDHFKGINDRFGHAVGDQVLANVGAVLRAAVRGGDFAGRNGGEEFCIVLPDTDVDGAREAAEKIRALIADISLPGLDLSITASIGIATYPEHAVSVERLERLADAALYLAKRSGRDRAEVARLTEDGAMVVNGAQPESRNGKSDEVLAGIRGRGVR
jgi:diguanylate cyclase (GGDEF)-like protein